MPLVVRCLLIVITANLVYFVWQKVLPYGTGRQVASGGASDAPSDSLQLYVDLDVSGDEAQADTSATGVAQSPQMDVSRRVEFEPPDVSEGQRRPEDLQRCSRLGPFASSSSAFEARDRLMLGVGVEPRVVIIEKNQYRYGLYSKRSERRSDLRRMQLELTRLGFDSFLIQRGAMENRLALGYFVSEANAEQQQQRLTGAGFTVEIKRFVDKSNDYWLALPVDTVDVLSAKFWTEVEVFYPGVGFERWPCERDARD